MYLFSFQKVTLVLMYLSFLLYLLVNALIFFEFLFGLPVVVLLFLLKLILFMCYSFEANGIRRQFI